MLGGADGYGYHHLYRRFSRKREANSGAGMVVYGREEMEVLEQWSAPAGAVTSSFAAEALALQEALGWLRTSTWWTQAAVITDCQTLLAALEGDEGGCMIIALRETLWELGECNEGADARPREEGVMHQGDVELDLATRRAEIRRRMRKDYLDRRLITSRDLPGERREKLE